MYLNKSIFLNIQGIIRISLSLGLFIAMARLLEIEVFAKIQQIYLILGIFGILFSMGVPSALSYFSGLKSSEDEKLILFKKLLLLQIILSIVGGFVYYLLKEFLSNFFNNQFLVDFSILIIVMMQSLITAEFFKNLATITNTLKKYTFYTSFIQLISVSVSLIILFTYKNIYFLIISIAFFNAVTFAFLLKFNYHYLTTNIILKLLTKKEIKYILVMGFVIGIGTINNYMDQIMISILMDPYSFAIIKIGGFQIPVIGLITGSLLTIMLPMISQMFSTNDYTGIINIWKNSIERSSILLIPIVVFCLIFAEDLIILFFGEVYQEAIIVFQVYMLQWLRSVVIFAGVMGAIGLENALFKNNIVVMVLNVILNVILIKEYGVIGAAISTTLLSYFSAYLLIKPIDKKLKVSFFSYFPAKIYLTSLFLSVIISLLSMYLYNFFEANNIFIFIITSVLYYVIVVLLLIKIFFDKITLKTIRNII